MNLTPKQLRTLKIIHDYRSSFGFSPTYEEIGRASGTIKETAWQHVHNLIAKGAIVSNEKESFRSLSLTPAAIDLLNSTRRTRLPFVGEINGPTNTIVPARIGRDFCGRAA